MDKLTLAELKSRYGATVGEHALKRILREQGVDWVENAFSGLWFDLAEHIVHVGSLPRYKLDGVFAVLEGRGLYEPPL